ncbi:hypothetical protein PENSPDRAFT_672718, partial [Peniophora sp. CONT]
NDTVMVNTLTRLESFVRCKACTAEAPPKQKKMKMAKSMDAMKKYMIHPDDFMNRNSFKIHRDRFNGTDLEKQSVNALYYFFSHAHGHSKYPPPCDPGNMEPPWSAMATPGKLFDPKYLPPAVTMGEPAKMKLKDCMKVLNQILDLGELEFHHWKPRRGEVMELVDFDMRYWSCPPIDPEAEAFEAARAEACAAWPVHFAPSRIPGSGAEGSASGGPHSDELLEHGPQSTCTPRVVISPYGSYCAARVHDDSLREDHALLFPPTFAKLPDPNDRLPEGADPDNLDAPCSVPDNVKAKAQWCWVQASRSVHEGRLSATLFKKCVTLLSEIPFFHNHLYDASNFRKQKMTPYLPPCLTWSAPDLMGANSAAASHALEEFITCGSWCYTYKGEEYFTGVEM